MKNQNAFSTYNAVNWIYYAKLMRRKKNIDIGLTRIMLKTQVPSIMGFWDYTIRYCYTGLNVDIFRDVGFSLQSAK